MKIRIALVSAALLLTLTGCAGAPDAAGDERTAPATTESAAPLTAEATEDEAIEAPKADEQYLTDVRTALTNGRETTIPNATDEQLVQAGQDACEQLAAGTAEGEVRVVEGEQMDEQWGDYRESVIITGIARKHLC